MSAMILPGVYIEVRPEGLIAPGQITVGNVGVVGTAAKGPVNTPVLLGSYAEAQQTFGQYDPWLDPDTGVPAAGTLTLVRALEIAFNFGATTVYAVRIADSNAIPAAKTLLSGANKCVILSAKSSGTWANGLWASVAAKKSDVFIEDESVPTAATKLRFPPSTIDSKTFTPSARDRISVLKGGTLVLLAITTKAPDPNTQQVQLAADWNTDILHRHNTCGQNPRLLCRRQGAHDDSDVELQPSDGDLQRSRWQPTSRPC